MLDLAPLQSTHCTLKCAPGSMMSAYSINTSASLAADMMREVAVNDVAVVNASKVFEINSAESNVILNGFDDDIKNVTEQVLERDTKPRHRTDFSGPLKLEVMVAFMTVAAACWTANGSKNSGDR